MTKPNKTKDELRDDAENQPTPADKIKKYNDSRSPLGGYTLNSRVSQLAKKEYTNGGTTLVKGEVTLGSLGKTGPRAWSEADFYKDNNGYSAVITHESYTKDPYEIHIQIPNGNEKTLFILNTQTMMQHDGANAVEAARAIKKMEQKIKKGASLEEIASDFQSYQRSEYPAEIAKDVAIQKAVNNEIAEKINKMRTSGSYSMCVADTDNSRFDTYMQRNFAGAPILFVAQNTRDLTGDITANIKENYTLSLQYNEKSTDVKEIVISHPNYEFEQVGFTKYEEILNMETLMQYGYDKENAQRKLNEVAEQLYAGKNLKQLFLDNRQFMTEKSSKLLKEDMAKRAQQQKPDLTKLKNSSIEGHN